MSRSALRIAGIYVAFGAAGILIAQQLVTLLASHPDALAALHFGKDWFMLLLTAGLLAWLVNQEILARERAKEDLRQSQAQFAGVIASAMDAIISVDADQHIVLFNRAAEQMFGCPADRAIGQPLDVFLPERYRKHHRELVAAFGRTNVTRRRMGEFGAVTGLRANGEEFPLEASISQLDVGGHKLYNAILRDVTDRYQAEERIREQATLLDQASDAILVRSLDDEVIYWNRGAERLYGWDAASVIGKKLHDVIGKDNTATLEEADRTVRQTGGWQGEFRQVKRDDTAIVVESRWTLVRDRAGQPKSVLIVNSDVTEKKRLEAQFLRAQRLESIGTLAGGIAHDLNNILTPMAMAVKLLRRNQPEGQRNGLLNTLQASVERAAELVKQVLAFAGGVEGGQALVDIAHVIGEVQTILRHTLPKTIALQVSLGESLWKVRGDATQLSQVLMNLCVNARDAMTATATAAETGVEDPARGTLTIAVANTVLDKNYARIQLGAKPGPHVLITVADTGTGIQPQVMDKMYDPFFTTKDKGKGTGLGLSTALGIVRSHGGFITVYSEVGKGASFNIYLPAVEGPATEQAIELQKALPLGHGELILVVDDETPILEVARATLESHGYRALTANDGRQAVDLYRAHQLDISAVLLDMMMPIMDGPETVQALEAINPNVRIIATSGLRSRGTAADIATAGVKAFLPKPYTAENLLELLGRIVGAH